MSLPRIKITYQNGQLGAVGDSPDGLFALVCGASAVSGTFELNKAYSVHSVDELLELGVTSAGSPRLYKHVSDFYDEAESGTELVVMGVSKTSSLTSLLDKASGVVKDLISAENGKLRGVFVAQDGLSSGSVTDGLSADVFTALPKAQSLAEWATDELYAPLFIIIEGRGYSGENVKDLSTMSYNRVGVVIGDTESGSEGACVGILAGRLSNLPVQRNAGRVKDGALSPLEMWIGKKKVEESNSAVGDLYEKGYITPRKYVGRSGYYWTDDRLACDATDDYAHLTNRRVIDKAYRTAYDTLLDIMLDELDVNEDGTLQTGVVRSWQQAVEDAINKNMTANGELSASDDGEGCECWIDQTQNVVSTSKLKMTLKVRPHGYARYVDVELGFDVET